MNVSLCSDTVCNLQEAEKHSSPAECASDAHAVSADMEDLAPATPTKPLAAVQLGSPLTPMGCTPMDTALPTAPVAAVHAEQASASFEQSAQPKQLVSADAAEDVEAGLSTPRVDRTSSSAGCASAAQSVEDVVEMLLTAGRVMHQAETESSALDHPDRFDLPCPFFGRVCLLFITTKRNKGITQRNFLLHKPRHSEHICNLSSHAASHSQRYEACFVAVCILAVFGISQCEHEVQ